MRKDDEHIFEALKNRVDDFRMPVEDRLWTQIEAGIQDNNGRKFLWKWWLGFGLILLIMILLGLYYVNVLNTYADQPLSIPPNEAISSETSLQDSNAAPPATLYSMTIPQPPDGESVSRPSQQSNPRGNVSVPFAKTRSLDALVDSAPSKDSASTEVALVPVEIMETRDSGLNDLFGIVEFIDVKTKQNNSLISKDICAKIPINPVEVIKPALANKDQTVSPNRLRLLMFGGPGASFRTLNSPIHKDLVQHKDAHESIGWSYDLSALLQYPFSEKSFFNIGLTYKSYTERYAFHHDIISHNTTNDYTYLQIPLQYGRAIFKRNQSALYVLGGIKVSRLLSAQSSWVDPNELIAVAHQNKGDAHPFQNWTYVASMGLDYQLQLLSNWRLHIMPGYDNFLNSVYQSQSGLVQRPYAFQLNIGLSYGF